MIDNEEEIRGVVAIRINVSPSHAVETGKLECGPKLYYPDAGQWANASLEERRALEPYIKGSDVWRCLYVKEPTWAGVLRALEVGDAALPEIPEIQGLPKQEARRYVMAELLKYGIKARVITEMEPGDRIKLLQRERQKRGR